MKLKRNVLLNILLINCMLLVGCGQPKAPNEKDIEDAVVTYNMMEFSASSSSNDYDDTNIMNSIDDVCINQQQTESKTNISYCTVEMSNENCGVVMDCNFKFEYYDDKKWYPEDYEIENVSFNPKKGIDEGQAYEAVIENVHIEPEVFSPGSRTSSGYVMPFFGESYSYECSYELQLVSHETDLEGYTDKLVYDYSKSSEFCTESGRIETHYSFNTSEGVWEFTDTFNDDICYEYHPEGQWRFDIFTHYFRINISNVDYVNNTATIDYKDSSWQGSADSGEMTNQVQVDYSITDEGMRFSPFHVESGSGLMKYESDVYLLLKNDTMYVSSDGSTYSPVAFPRYAN